MPDHVCLTVPSEGRSLALVEALCASFCEELEISAGETREIVAILAEVVRFTLANAYPDDVTGQIEVTLDLVDHAVQVGVHDWGRPLESGDGELGTLPRELSALSPRTDDLLLINLGAEGKRISFRKQVSHALDTGPEAHDFDAPRRSASREDTRERVEIRDATAQDAEAISQLLYSNYHLSYGHPDFYRPGWVAQEIEAGRLLSSVALLDGELVGHHAAMLEEGSSSAETGVAVIHPSFRGLGIFTTLANYTLERTIAFGLDAVWGREVTVHPYSQRSAHARGYRETGIMLGSVPTRMQMEGIGGVEPGRRTASLLGFRVLRPSPRALALPRRYADLLRTALANAGLVAAAARKEQAAGEPVTWSEEESRGTALVRVTRWDEHAFVHTLRHELARHVDVVYADLDLTSGAASDEAVARLNTEGFFYAGLALFGPEGHDHLRLQLLNAENVELERIVCDSDFAQGLLRAVLADRARVEA